MKTKHTKEYAIKISSKVSEGFSEPLTEFEKKLVEIGYLTAIKETAAPELLEALEMLWTHVKLNNEDAASGNYDEKSVFGKVVSAIKKAQGE